MKVLLDETASGRSPVERFLLELPQATRAEVVDALALLECGH
jgi:hypothetical protein